MNSNLGSSGVITAVFNPALYNENGSQLAVEVLIEGILEIASLSAVSMVMRAQTFKGAWRTRLVLFPVTAQRVKVDVVLSRHSDESALVAFLFVLENCSLEGRWG